MNIFFSLFCNSRFLFKFSHRFLLILPVEDCRSGSRKLVAFKHFSQRSFLDFNYDITYILLQKGVFCVLK